MTRNRFHVVIFIFLEALIFEKILIWLLRLSLVYFTRSKNMSRFDKNTFVCFFLFFDKSAIRLQTRIRYDSRWYATIIVHLLCLFVFKQDGRRAVGKLFSYN